MSGFDENPFGDPEASFGTRNNVAPTNTAPANQGLEDYNPFDDGSRAGVRGAANPPNYNQPATVQPTVAAPPPNYNQSAQQRVDTADLQRKQEELERKAKELERREEELRAGPYNARKNNWPPLPSFSPVGPCFYQDINIDIPLDFQKIVRWLYYLWIFHAFLLFLNILGTLALLIEYGQGVMFGLAILYFILFTPFSYVCWFRPVYKAFRSDSSFNFFVFFFVFAAQFLVSVINAIGIPDMGSCGFIVGLSIIAKGGAAGYTVGAIVLILAFGYAAVSLGCFFLMVKVHRIYRSTGASFEKAQAEFASGVMRNETVQTAATGVATAAVRNQMAGQGGNRY